jgi:hypothetical protein
MLNTAHLCSAAVEAPSDLLFTCMISYGGHTAGTDTVRSYRSLSMQNCIVKYIAVGGGALL